MGMKKTRLTRKRSINNSLVGLTSPSGGGSFTVRVIAGPGMAGVGSGDGLQLPALTRERISLGPGSPTGELPPASPLNGFESPQKLSVGPGESSIKRFQAE